MVSSEVAISSQEALSHGETVAILSSVLSKTPRMAIPAVASETISSGVEKEAARRRAASRDSRLK